MDEIGSRVRELRKARKLTQKQLAEQASISEISIKTLEGGKYTPRGDTLDKLARALAVPVSTLLGENDPLAGAFPAGQLRAEGLPNSYLLRYEGLWPDLSRADRVTLLGHLRIIADAERRLQALEAAAREAADGDLPASAAGPPVLVHLIP